MIVMTVTMVIAMTMTVKTVTIIRETETVKETETVEGTEMVAETMMVEEASLPHTETDCSDPEVEEEEEEMMIPFPHQEGTLYLRQEEEGLPSLMTRASDSYHKLW